MLTLGDRLKQIIENQGDTIRQFCIKNEITYNSLISIINNQRSLGINVLFQLKKAIPDLNAQWLLFGEQTKSVNTYDNTQIIQSFNEPTVSDPVKETFLKYMDHPEVKKLIEETVKKIIKDGK